MTSGPLVDGPGLSRWRDQLSAFRPHALWVGTLDLVHLDAPVRVLRPEPLDPLHRLLLRAVEAIGSANLNRLDAELGLGRPALYRWLDELRTAGLVRFNDHYALTPAGAAALSTGMASWPVAERRQFTFVCSSGSAHFISWSGAPGLSVPALAAAANGRWLTDCIARPSSWKRRTGFPEDVAALANPDNARGLPAWKQLTVAHGERPAVALVRAADAPAHIIGFTVQRGELNTNSPAFQLDAGWDQVFPELIHEPAGPRTEVGGGWVLVGEGRLRLAERKL